MATSGRKNADDTLIGLLANGATVAYAAKAAGIAERTAHRRLQDPAFRQRVQAVRAQALERAVALLGTAAGSAVSTLVKLLDAPSDAVRLGSARAILELGSRLRESVELEARLAALEAGAGLSR